MTEVQRVVKQLSSPLGGVRRRAVEQFRADPARYLPELLGDCHRNQLNMRRRTAALRGSIVAQAAAVYSAAALFLLLMAYRGAADQNALLSVGGEALLVLWAIQWSLGPTLKQRATMHALETSTDIRAIGPISELLPLAGGALFRNHVLRARARDSLLALLPLVREESRPDLTAFQLDCLCRSMSVSDVTFAKAVLGALPWLGGSNAIGHVARFRASLKEWGARGTQTDSVAAECMRRLSAKAGRAQEASSLLRPAGDDGRNEEVRLLRPAAGEANSEIAALPRAAYGDNVKSSGTEDIEAKSDFDYADLALGQPANSGIQQPLE